MNPLRWWETEGVEEWAEYKRRLLSFEDSVFLAFPTDPPSREMPLVNNKTWTGHEWKPYPHQSDNDDTRNVIKLLDWRPWPQLIGYRTMHIGDVLRVYLSIEALRYYVPAFMLHWLYFRYEARVVDGEIEELFIPPDDKILCEEFSGYGLRNERYYDGFDIDRFYWFRDGITVEQRQVCREFCSLWIPWKYRDQDFSTMEEAYARLLGYWT
jgi:hypothetical protein